MAAMRQLEDRLILDERPWPDFHLTESRPPAGLRLRCAFPPSCCQNLHREE